jgi:CheY-like chemotaxis protein
VPSGAEALDAVRLHAYAAVLMDCQMPVMDGFTTTERLRAQTREQSPIPVIAVTATATAEDLSRSLAVGMDDYLPKPIVLERLAATLERWAPLPSV